MVWHLIAKNKGNIIFDVTKFTSIGEVWKFISEMKNDLFIDEIIWSICDKNHTELDRPTHLKRKNDGWVREDILKWKDS